MALAAVGILKSRTKHGMDRKEMSSVLVGKLLGKRGALVDRTKMCVRKILYEDTKRVELTQECYQRV